MSHNTCNPYKDSIKKLENFAQPEPVSRAGEDLAKRPNPAVIT
jgi:hypothetical protein